MTTYLMTAGWASVAQSAVQHEMPAPFLVRIEADGVDLHLSSLVDLAQWAGWADATIAEGEPNLSKFTSDWTVHHKAEGTIHDLPVRLVAVEFGYMAEPEYYDCEKCGAGFGVSGGFVPHGAPGDDYMETEVVRHQDGECTRTVVAL